MERRFEVDFVKIHFTADIKAGRKTPPTELYFVWTALDNLSHVITGKKVFEAARDFALGQDPLYPAEHMFGYEC